MDSRISQKAAVGVVFVAVMFMSIMDVTIVNVALPTIGRDFHVSPTAVDSIAISFLVSLAVFIPASGWLGDRFGGKRVLLIAIVVFTGASALCGIATSLGELVAFRILQGAGGGMLAPVGMAMLYRVFPPEERIRAAGDPDRADHARARARPGPRRAADHRGVLALDLLREPADRRRGLRLRACCSCRKPASLIPGDSTCPGSCCPGSASGC